MRLVGASNFFIYMPYLVSSLIYAVFSLPTHNSHLLSSPDPPTAL